MKLKILKKAEDIPRGKWDAIFSADTAEGYDYYRSLDESNLPGFSIYYALLYDAGRIIAIAPFFTTGFSLSTTIQGHLKNIILSIQKRFPNFLKLKMLFFGSPLTEEGAIGFCRDCNIEEALDFLLDEISHLCRDKGISVITFYNLTSGDSHITNLLKKKRFVSMEAFPLARVMIKEASLEEYIQNLGPSTRKDLRRKLKKARAGAEIRIEERDKLDGLLDRAYGLYLNNLNKSGVSFEKLTPEYFKQISENMPGITKFFIAWIKDKMVAFNLCLIKNDLFIDKYIGFDYDYAHKYNLYYVTWCHNIDWCIRNNVRYYQPGTCDYDPKIRLGGRLVPLYISTKLLNPVLNFATRPVLKLIEPKRFDPVLKDLSRYEKRKSNP